MFLIMRGGPVWDYNVFLKSVTYRPTLKKFRGGQLKKNPVVKYIDLEVFLRSLEQTNVALISKKNWNPILTQLQDN